MKNWSQLSEEQKIKFFKNDFQGSVSEWRKKLQEEKLYCNYDTLKSFARRHQELLEIDQVRDKISKKSSSQEKSQYLITKAHNQEFLSKLRETVQEQFLDVGRKIEKPRFDKGKDDEDVVLHISDAHVGAKISEEYSGGLACYNKDIFLQRLEDLKGRTLRLLDIVSGYANIQNLWIIYSGDMVEGHDIFKGQSYSLDLSAAEASLLAAESFADFELTLFKHANCKKIITSEIPGNHGVPGGKQAGDVPLTLNFDWLTYYMKDLIVQNSLSQSKTNSKGKTIERNISNTWFSISDICGFKFVTTHGNEIRKYLTMPFYSMLRLAAQYLRLLGIHFDYWLTSHYHTPCSLPIQGGEILMNGSFPGASMLSTRFMAEKEPACQRMFSVHPHRGITARWKILLEDIKNNNSVEVISS